MSTLCPYPGRVMIEPYIVEDQSSSGILLNAAKHVPTIRQGQIVMTDPLDTQGEIVMGDLVLFGVSEASRFVHEGVEYLSVPSKAIMGLFEP